MAFLRRTVLATSLIGAGLLGSTGMAVAEQEQSGVANVDDTQTVTPLQACNNNVPVNVLGVQVPVQDNAADVPIGSEEASGEGAGAGPDKSCGQPTKTTT